METKRKISVPKVTGSDRIDVEKLDSAVLEVLEDFDSSKENEDTSEMISKSVMDYLDKNDLKTPNDLTLVVNSNADISKPKIKVGGFDEIEVDVQIPDDVTNLNVPMIESFINSEGTFTTTVILASGFQPISYDTFVPIRHESALGPPLGLEVVSRPTQTSAFNDMLEYEISATLASAFRPTSYIERLKGGLEDRDRIAKAISNLDIIDAITDIPASEGEFCDMYS